MNRNEDAEMDTRKHKKISHQTLYSQGKDTHKANKHFPREETTVMVRSVMCSGEMATVQVLSRPGGRPDVRWVDCAKDDMGPNKIRPEWASDGESWFDMINNFNTTQKTTGR